MSNKLIYSILLFFVMFTNGFSQIVEEESLMTSKEFRPSIGLGLGMLNYFGDVNSNSNHGSFFNQLGYKIHVSRKINQYADLGFSFLTGTIVGNERSIDRNLNFKTNIYSGSVYVSYNFWHFMPQNSVLEPYVTIGFESFEYNNKSDLVDANGNKYFYWTDGTIRSLDQNSVFADQAVLMQRDYEYETDLRSANLDGLGKYPQLSIGVPLGLGANLRVTDRMNFKIGSTFHFTFTDLIDNVSSEGVGVRKGSAMSDFFIFNSMSLHYDLLNTPRRVNPEDFEFPDFFVLDMVDGDLDGVVDGLDDCPETPEGVAVDEHGCPLDDDNDGVPNYRDEELATADTAFVNEKGVTLTDEDYLNWYRKYIDSVDIPIEVLYRIAGKAQKSATYRILLGEFSGRLPEDLAKSFLAEGDVVGALTEKGETAYLAGKYGSLENAKRRRKELLGKGMPQATIVVWEGNRFIPLQEWKEKSEKEIKQRFKKEIQAKKDLNGMFAVKLGSTPADAHSSDKVKYFEYEDVVVLDGEQNQKDYVIGPFIDSVGASQVLQEVDRSKYPNATIVKVSNGKTKESGIDVDKIPVSKNPKGTSVWNRPKDPKKVKSEKVLKNLEDAFVIDFGDKKNPQTKALEQKIKATNNVVEVIDPYDGKTKLITKDPKTKAAAIAEVKKLKAEGLTTAKVAQVKGGKIVSVKESQLNPSNKKNILQGLEDAFVIDFGDKKDPKTKALEKKIKASNDVIEVVDPSDGKTKLIAKDPKTKAAAIAEVKKLKAEGLSTAKVAQVKGGKIVSIKESELNPSDKKNVLQDLEDAFVIDFGDKKDPKTKALEQKIKASNDVVEVVDPSDGKTKLITKDPKTKAAAIAEVKKLKAEGLSTAKVAQVKGGKIVSVKESQLNPSDKKNVLQDLEDAFVIDFGDKKDPKTKALERKIKASNDVVEVVDPSDGKTKLITKDPKTKAAAIAEVKKLKADGVSTAKVAQVKGGKIVSMKESQLNPSDKKNVLQGLEDTFVIDFGDKKNPKTKALEQKIKASNDVIEVVDPIDGTTKLITKDPKTKAAAIAEVKKLKAEGLSTAKVAQVKGGKIVSVKESQLNPSDKKNVLQDLEDAFVIDFGDKKDPKTKALEQKIKASNDVIEVVDPSDGKTKLITKDPKTKAAAIAEVKKLKAEGVSTAKVAQVKGGKIVSMKESQLNPSDKKNVLQDLEDAFVIDFGDKKDPKTKALERKIKASNDVVEVVDPSDGKTKLITKDPKTKAAAIAEVKKLKAEGVSTAKVAQVKGGKIVSMKESELKPGLPKELNKIEKKFVVKLGTVDDTTPLVDRQKLLNAPNTIQIKNDDGSIDVVTKKSHQLEEPTHKDKALVKRQGFQDAKVAYVRNGKVEVLKKEKLDGKFSISVGSFKSDVSNEEVNKIASLSDVESMETFNPDMTTYTIGNYDDPQEAKKRIEELVAQGFTPELIKYEDGRVKVIDLGSVFDAHTVQKLKSMKQNVNKVKTGDVVFRVQLGAYRGKINETVFSGVKTLAFPTKGGITKYVTGSFSTYQQAYIHKLEMRQMGFSGAFTVAYKDGKRISVTDLVNKESFSKVKENVSPIEKKLKKVEEKPKVKPQKQAQTPTQAAANKVRYRVQIGAFKDEAIQNKLTEFPDVTMEVYGQYKRYLSGDFDNYRDANSHKDLIKSKGFSGAFVVAYNGEERVAAPGDKTPNVIKTSDLEENKGKAQPNSKYNKNKLMILVQVGLYRGAIPGDLQALFNTLPNITKQVTPHGVVRYMTGNFKNPSEAAAYKEDLVKQGFEGAFLVAYYDSERIKIQQAIEIYQGK